MNPYNLTKQAVSDLENIWTYTYFQWSEKQADSILQNKINWNKVDYESTRYRIIGEEFLNSSCNIPTKY